MFHLIVRVLVAACALAAFPGTAQGADALTRLTITFLNREEQYPYAVCVLTRARGDGSLRHWPRQRDGDRWHFTPQKPAVIEQAVSAAQSDNGQSRATIANENIRNECLALAKRAGGAMRTALEELTKVDTFAAGSAPELENREMLSMCEPQAELGDPAEWNVACGLQARPAGNRPVVFVRLASPHSLNPRLATNAVIRQVQVDGNVASIELQGALAPGQYLIGSVVGGDYQITPQSEPTTSNGGLQLTLSLRCAQLGLRLPEVGSSEATFELEEATRGKLWSRVLALSGRDLPIVSPRTPGQYTLRLTASEGRRRDEFTARWSDDEDPRNIRLERTGLSFSWNRPCYYRKTPDNWCPTAILAASGIECMGAPEGPETADSDEETKPPASTCHYTCTAEPLSSSVIMIPSVVRFSGKNATEEVWTDSLMSAHDVLEGYVTSEQRRLRIIDLPTATLGLSRVRLRTPRGDVHELELPSASGGALNIAEPSIAFPGAGCSDSIEVEFVGSRTYIPDVARTEESTLCVAPASTPRTKQTAGCVASPKDLVERWTWGGAIQGGVSMVSADQLRRNDRPWAYVGLLGSFRPWANPWNLEARIGGMLTERRYAMVFDSPSDSRVAKPDVDLAFYVRFLLEVAAFYELGPSDWAVGGIAGGSVGHPLSSANADVVGGFQGALTAGPIVRYALSSGLSLEILVRFIWGEPVYVYRTDLRGETTQSDQNVRSPGWPRFMSIGFGLRFGPR